MSWKTEIVPTIVHKPVFYDVRCDACEEIIPFTFDEESDGVADSLQLEGGLHIYLDGTYGEFIDVLPSAGPRPHSTLCMTCAVEFCNTHSWFIPLLLPHLSFMTHYCESLSSLVLGEQTLCQICVTESTE